MFSKVTASLAAHEEIIKIPPKAHQMDYEAESVLVMGRRGNDVSARDLQLKTSMKNSDGSSRLEKPLRWGMAASPP